MFKKILLVTALVVVIGGLIFGAVNRTQAKGSSQSTGQGGNGNANEEVRSSAEQTGLQETQGQGNGGKGNGRGQGENGDHEGESVNLPPATPGELSDDETAALLYMREEEKLAHDVYVTLYTQWGLSIFQNISQSEQTHTEAVKTLLDRYGLADPASSQIGIFSDLDLQALYNDLIARGSQSLDEALKVGAAIEEIDLLDLEERLAQTDNADIQQVFENLLNGSGNHLRTFVSTLYNQTGEIYQPQYLSAEAYQAIIDTSTETGRDSQDGGYGQGGGNSQGGGYHGGRP